MAVLDIGNSKLTRFVWYRHIQMLLSNREQSTESHELEEVSGSYTSKNNYCSRDFVLIGYSCVYGSHVHRWTSTFLGRAISLAAITAHTFGSLVLDILHHYTNSWILVQPWTLAANSNTHSLLSVCVSMYPLLLLPPDCFKRKKLGETRVI